MKNIHIKSQENNIMTAGCGVSVVQLFNFCNLHMQNIDTCISLTYLNFLDKKHMASTIKRCTITSH